MVPATMSNSTSPSEDASVSSGTKVQDFPTLVNAISPPPHPPQQDPTTKKKRKQPGNPGANFFFLFS